MSSQSRINSWGQVVAGAVMLISLVIAATIKLANTVGIGKTLGIILLGFLLAAWLITGVVLIVRGLSKM